MRRNKLTHCDFTGNIVLIGIVATGGYLFVRYQAQQGKPIKAQAKKTN